MFQLFDLVEKSANVFAATVDNNNEPMMYPNSNVEDKENAKNTHCEDKLIHVKFVRVTQESLKRIKRCENFHTMESSQMDIDPIDKPGKKGQKRYVVVCCVHS